MAKRLKSFTVYAKVEIDCAKDIKAESLADAVSKANELKETDFVEVLIEYEGGKLKINGVYENL